MRLLRPLRRRDFAILWAGQATSMVGDGLYTVALPFLALQVDDRPGALAGVLLSWSVGLVVFLLAGGLLADRLERRSMLAAADVVRLLAVGAMGVLGLTGALELWMLVVLAFAYGAGEAIFQPAFGAFLPALVGGDDLMAANAALTFVRPLAMRFAGPALGGVLVASLGPGQTMVADAATFAVSLACVLALRARSRADTRGTGLLGDVAEGWRYVRAQPWLWATLIAAAISLLAFIGPLEVALPFRIRHDLGGDAGDYGAVLAAAGVGAMIAALVMARLGEPRRPVAFLYVAWIVAPLGIAGWGLARQTWQLAALGLLQGCLGAGGLIVWDTLMLSRVPPQLLGRVTSLDWLVSVGLTPLSFVLVAPAVTGFGTGPTLVGAGIVAAVPFLVFLPLAVRADRQAAAAAAAAA